MKLLLTLFITFTLSFGLKAQVQINNKQLKGIANPSDTTDAVNVKTIQSGNLLYATAMGTNAMNLTITPAITNYNAGMIINFKCPASNTNSVTLNVNGLGAKPLFKNVMDSLEAGNIRTGQMVSVIYDGNSFQLLSSPNTASLGKTFVTLSGDITDAEAATKILNEVGSNTQYINIQNCPILTTLDLSMVRSLDYITISNNINLQSVNLSNLKDVTQGITGPAFSIYSNPKLTALNLNSLQTIGGGITISNNNLSSINLPSLKYTSSFSIVGLSIISVNLGNAKLGSISINSTSISNINFNQIKNLTNGLNISNNPLLTSISLSNLDSIGSNLTVSNNSLFTSLNLTSLKKVNGGITFSYNQLFTTLNLSSINSAVGTINISNNNALTSIDCSKIIRTSLSLSQDTSLQSIYFNSLKSIQAYLDFGQFKKLTTLNFGSLDTIIGDFTFVQCPLLTSLNLSSLKYTTGNINVAYNPLLTSVNLSSLINTPYALTFSNNYSLTSIDCSNLASCQSLKIDSDTLLTSINFDKLKKISSTSSGGALSISYSKLSTISFPLLDTMYSGIEITYNSYLTSVSMNSLIKSGNLSPSSDFRINYNPLLASISHPNFKSFYSINFRFNRLSTSTINDLLACYVNITPTLSGKTIQLNSQVPTAAPSGAGITNKATLVSRGNNVQTD